MRFISVSTEHGPARVCIRIHPRRLFRTISYCRMCRREMSSVEWCDFYVTSAHAPFVSNWTRNRIFASRSRHSTEMNIRAWDVQWHLPFHRHALLDFQRFTRYVRTHTQSKCSQSESTRRRGLASGNLSNRKKEQHLIITFRWMTVRAWSLSHQLIRQQCSLSAAIGA